MNTIQATARSLIAEEGSIGAIIDLLEDPEDARFNLKPEIESIKKSAKKCLENAEAITSKFAYWHLVIMHLKQTSLTKRGRCATENWTISGISQPAIVARDSFLHPCLRRR